MDLLWCILIDTANRVLLVIIRTTLYVFKYKRAVCRSSAFVECQYQKLETGFVFVSSSIIILYLRPPEKN